MDEIRQRMVMLMADAGLDYGDRSMTYNSRLAQELGTWADTQPGGYAIHDAIYRAYFVEGKNIASKETLIDLATSIGLDSSQATKVLEQRLCSDQVDKDWARSRECQVTGVPTLLAGNHLLVGCQPFEELERFVQFVQQSTI